MPPKKATRFAFLDALDRGSLESQKLALTTKYMELNMQGADDDATKTEIKKYADTLGEIQRRLDNMEVKLEPRVETTVVTQNHQPYHTDCAQFRALIDKVEKF